MRAPIYKDPCDECLAELGDIARIAEEVWYFLFSCHVLCGQCGIYVNVKLSLTILQK